MICGDCKGNSKDKTCITQVAKPILRKCRNEESLTKYKEVKTKTKVIVCEATLKAL